MWQGLLERKEALAPAEALGVEGKIASVDPNTCVQEGPRTGANLGSASASQTGWIHPDSARLLPTAAPEAKCCFQYLSPHNRFILRVKKKKPMSQPRCFLW